MRLYLSKCVQNYESNLKKCQSKIRALATEVTDNTHALRINELTTGYRMGYLIMWTTIQQSKIMHTLQNVRSYPNLPDCLPLKDLYVQL